MADYQHDIEKYLKGELTPAERHALEKKALSDPFLADALEGAEQIGASAFSKDAEELNKKFTTQKGTSFWMWPMRIAAGIALVAASSYIIWFVLETQPESQQLALEKNEAITSQPIVSDSITGGEIASQTQEQPAATSKKDIASRSIYPSKAETKPQQSVITEQTDDYKSDAIAVEEAKAEELKVVEAIPQTRQAEKETEDLKAKTEDVQRAKKLSFARDNQRKEAAPSAGATVNSTRVITGRVTSSEDGSALPGINVIIKGSTTGTVTNIEGYYQIEVSNPNSALTYSFIGLQSKEVTPGTRTEVDVAMAMDVTQLSEVVVTGNASSDGESNLPATVDLAHPSTGYKIYKQYLQQNIRYPEQARINKIEGRVTVEFIVEATGALSDFKVIRGIGSGCDEELIRLIKEGPVWIPTRKDEIPLQDKAKVRLKFELPK